MTDDSKPPSHSVTSATLAKLHSMSVSIPSDQAHSTISVIDDEVHISRYDYTAANPKDFFRFIETYKIVDGGKSVLPLSQEVHTPHGLKKGEKTFVYDAKSPEMMTITTVNNAGQATTENKKISDFIVEYKLEKRINYALACYQSITTRPQMLTAPLEPTIDNSLDIAKDITPVKRGYDFTIDGNNIIIRECDKEDIMTVNYEVRDNGKKFRLKRIDLSSNYEQADAYLEYNYDNKGQHISTLRGSNLGTEKLSPHIDEAIFSRNVEFAQMAQSFYDSLSPKQQEAILNNTALVSKPSSGSPSR